MRAHSLGHTRTHTHAINYSLTLVSSPTHTCPDKAGCVACLSMIVSGTQVGNCQCNGSGSNRAAAAYGIGNRVTRMVQGQGCLRVAYINNENIIRGSGRGEMGGNV
jgi:hypothetical protein